MQVAFYIIPTIYKQLTSNTLNMNIEKIYKVCERAKRASLEIFEFLRSKTSRGGGGALDFQMVGVCRWGVENRTLS